MEIPLIPDQDGECADQLRALSGATGDAVTLDLERVTHLSSTALVELIRFRRRFEGPAIVLRHPNALVLRTLNIVGAARLFAIEDAGAEPPARKRRSPYFFRNPPMPRTPATASRGTAAAIRST